MEENKFKLPTETIELPSKGYLYPKDHPLHNGKIEIKYMTAKEEDILTNQNYIKNGTVIDKLLKSLIITEFDYDDLFIGDKNAIMIAARILAYGADYEIEYQGIKQSIDVNQIQSKPLHFSITRGSNNHFEYTLPYSGNKITFKILSQKDENRIDAEIKGLQKINKDNTNEITTRLSTMITSINESTEAKDIKDFVKNYFLSKDARAFRLHYNEISPDINLKIPVMTQDGEEDIDLPIGLSFFWPDSRA